MNQEEYEKKLEWIDRRIAHCDKWIGIIDAFLWCSLGALVFMTIVPYLISWLL